MFQIILLFPIYLLVSNYKIFNNKIYNVYILLLLIFLSNSINDNKLDGIYSIININNNLNFKISNNKIILTTNHKSNFRIIKK